MTIRSNDAPDRQEKEQRPQPRGGGGEDRSKSLGPEESFRGPEDAAASEKKKTGKRQS
jgi:hypothetical protein